MYLFSIYDRKAAFFLPVFSLRSQQDARRQFVEIVTGDTPIAKYPGDYDLVCLGEFNDQDGEVIPYSPRETIINGLTALQAAHSERERYRKALDTQQLDIEDAINQAT